MAELNYKVGDEQEMSFDPIPSGDYYAVIENSEYVTNKKETGMILNLTWQVIDGKFKGRKVFESLNLEHKNQQAQQIARGAMNAICTATGISNLKDSSQLHNIPMMITVGIQTDKTGMYPDKNNIKKHKAIEKGQAPAQQSAVETGTPANGAGPGPINVASPNVAKAPWED